jgi:hypothetical protein
MIYPKRVFGLVLIFAAIFLTSCDRLGIEVQLPDIIGNDGEAVNETINEPVIIPPPAGLRRAFEPREMRLPSPGSTYIYENNVVIDTSNVSHGYVMVRYTGDVSRVAVQIFFEHLEEPQNYFIYGAGNWEVFPLVRGNGTYTVNVLENVEGQMFALALSKTFDVSLVHHTYPFLYPNQFVNFGPNSRAIALAADLARGADNDFEVIFNIYTYVINNITYNFELANAVDAGNVTSYLPDIDAVLAAKTGICFDYASLMAAMLRAQHIPTRLDIGFVSGGIFHAWISIYTPETGWVGVMNFDGAEWNLVDPTFSAGALQGGDISQFVGNADDYHLMFIH